VKARDILGGGERRKRPPILSTRPLHVGWGLSLIGGELDEHTIFKRGWGGKERGLLPLQKNKGKRLRNSALVGGPTPFPSGWGKKRTHITKGKA